MHRALKGGLGLAMLGLVLGASPAPAGPASSIEISAGHFRNVSWQMEMRRQAGAAEDGRLGASHPCLVMVTKRWVSRYSYDRTRYRTCADEGGRLGAGESPLIASSSQPNARGGSTLSFVGISAAGAVRSVVLALGDGTSRTIPLQRLTPKQARQTGDGRLAYTALVLRGPWCAERLTTLNGRGRVLWDSGTDSYDCPSSSLVSR